MPTKTVRPANNNDNNNSESREAAAAYGWQRDGNDGSQVNMVVTDGILEGRELEMGFEDQGRNERDKDEEYDWG